MDEPKPEHLRRIPSLNSAIRTARIEEAERSEVVAELRGAELARLEMLHEAIQPVLAQIPDHVDIFDAGVVAGGRPRLFIDMIGFVEMGRDRRAYRFIQDTRHGRVTIAESEKLDTMVEAVTAYIARRLVEREKALAADRTIEDALEAQTAEPAESRLQRPAFSPKDMVEPVLVRPVYAPQRGWRHRFADLLNFLLDFFGTIAIVVLLGAGGYFGYKYFVAWWTSRYGAPPF